MIFILVILIILIIFSIVSGGDERWTDYLKVNDEYYKLINIATNKNKTTYAQVTTPEAIKYKAQQLAVIKPRGQHVLVDIGCGDGTLSQELAKIFNSKLIHCDIEDNRNASIIDSGVAFVKIIPRESIISDVKASNPGGLPYIILCSHISHHDLTFFDYRLRDLAELITPGDYIIIKDHDVVTREHKYQAMLSHIIHEIWEYEFTSRGQLINFIEDYEHNPPGSDTPRFHFTSREYIASELKSLGFRVTPGSNPTYRDRSYVMHGVKV